MDLKDIKAIIDLMKENDLSVFEMEKEGLKIRLQKEATANGQPIMAAPIAIAPGAAAAGVCRRDGGRYSSESRP